MKCPGNNIRLVPPGLHRITAAEGCHAVGVVRDRVGVDRIRWEIARIVWQQGIQAVKSIGTDDARGACTASQSRNKLLLS